MKMFTGILSSFIKRNQDDFDSKTNYIFYKIVGLTHKNHEYLLQCINTKATFQASISEIIFDIDILYGLHPIQACYIGIEYSKHIKKLTASTIKQQQKEKLNKHSVHRYGNHKLLFQNRNGDVCFTNKSNQEFLMDPRDIALSEELIQEFDAAQAFHIGLLAGFKLNSSTKKYANLPEPAYSALNRTAIPLGTEP